jgi:hypothetical protein
MFRRRSARLAGLLTALVASPTAPCTTGTPSSTRTSGSCAPPRGGDNTYYWSTPTGWAYRAYYFPRGDSDYGNPSTDTIVNTLDEVRCSYTGGDGE